MPGKERHFDVTLEAGQELDALLILHRNGEVEPAAAALPISDGGAGVVYRAQTRSGMDLAVKLLSPEMKLVAGVDIDAFLKTFDREIAVLSRVTHTRVAKIISSGVASIHGHDVPFYAMEYIEGQRLDEYLATADFTGQAFLALIDQLLDGLEYLHRRRILHADLKGENMLVREQVGQSDAKILDLGVAKVLDAALTTHAPEDDDGGTYFYSSPKITRPEWRPRLGKRVSHADLAEMFPSHDLYSLGAVLSDALGSDGLRERLTADLGRAGVAALDQICHRLLRLPADGQYRTVEALRADWEKLHPRYLSPLGVPELASGAEATTSIATPSGRVSLPERALDAINHPLMQRLRLVPQLELVQFVYPGATHTRLLHSIGTFDVTRRYVTNLLRDPSFRLLVSPTEVEGLLLSALFHDVGHYPLSHMFEDWAYQESRAGEPAIPSDDDLFWSLIDPAYAATTPWARFADVVVDRLADSAEPLASYLTAPGRYGSDSLDAMRDMGRLATPSHRLLRGVLDSPIDADKVAYLTDDSAMTGVRFGLGMDLDGLFASLITPREDDLTDDRVPVIAIEDKGLPAAEQVMLARYWMLRRVYWHHTNRSIMSMVKYVIAELRAHGDLDMVDYFGETLFVGPTEALAYLGRRFDEGRASGSYGDPSPVNPLQGLAAARRDLYKRLLTVAKGDAGASGRIFERLQQRRGEALLRAAETIREELASKTGRSVLPGEVLIDVPQKERARSATPVLVYLRGRSSPKLIEDASPMIGELVREFDTHVRKARVFVSPQLMAAISATDEDAIRRHIVGVLEEV